MDETADAESLRQGVRERYRDVALNPDGSLGSYTGRRLAAKLGYPGAIVDAMPDRAVESFAGVSSPFSLRQLERGERVVDVGSGAGFDAFVAAGLVGDEGRVVGVDMTPEMVRKSQDTARALGLDQVEFREGLAENLPIEDGWADVVISNGVINLCADKRAVLAEIHRVLRPGGALQFADVATGRPAVPASRAVAAPGRGAGAAHAGPVRRACAPPGHRGRGAGRMAGPVLLLGLRDHPRHRPGDGHARA